RVLQSAPAIQQHKNGDCPGPYGMRPEGKTDEPGHAQETEDGGYHQASGTSQHKPQKRAKYLAAIQWIDGQDIENQQDYVDQKNRPQEGVSIGIGRGPSERSAQSSEAKQNRQERHIHQRSSGNAPESS